MEFVFQSGVISFSYVINFYCWHRVRIMCVVATLYNTAYVLGTLRLLFVYFAGRSAFLVSVSGPT